LGSKYEIAKYLRLGGEGWLQVIRDVNTRQLYVSKTSINDDSKLRKEYETLKAVAGPSILQAESLLELYYRPIVIAAYCQGGDLSTFKMRFAKHNMQMPEALLWCFYAQMVEAVDWIHNKAGSHPILHLDIKPSNFLVKREASSTPGFEGYPQLLLADSGCAKSKEDAAKLDTTNYGTKLFQPQERPRYTKAADVWAIGSTMQWIAVHKSTWNYDFNAAKDADTDTEEETEETKELDDADFERRVFDLHDSSGWKEDHYGVDGGLKPYSQGLNDAVRHTLRKGPGQRIMVEDLKNMLDKIAPEKVRELYVPLADWAIPPDPVDDWGSDNGNERDRW
jgi:serine/threonine protein kinase